MSGFGFGAAIINGVGATLITDAAVIINITNESNWSEAGYIGPATGLVNGNYYWDSTYNQFYQYLNSVLTRTTRNTFGGF